MSCIKPATYAHTKSTKFGTINMQTIRSSELMIHRHGFVPQKSVNASIRTFKPLSVSNVAVGVSETFVRLKKQGKAAFIPFLTAGDPDLSTTAEALKILDRSGAAMIELGVPCSCPFADGPVIQASCARALANGTNLDSILTMAKTVTPELSCPIVLFSYYQLILKYGVCSFMSTIKDAGIRGLVIPDLPIKDTDHVSNEAVRNCIQLVLLTTPTTPMEQMQAIVRATTGFVYLVSSNGVTGERKTVNGQVEFLLQQIKRVTDKPVAVGFGLSKPEHVQQVVQWGADGAIVGSALVRLMAEAKSPEQGLRELESFSKNLASALAV